jgi:hypothetical protein
VRPGLCVVVRPGLSSRSERDRANLDADEVGEDIGPVHPAEQLISGTVEARRRTVPGSGVRPAGVFLFKNEDLRLVRKAGEISGKEFDRMFLRMMIEHHRGPITARRSPGVLGLCGRNTSGRSQVIIAEAGGDGERWGCTSR